MTQRFSVASEILLTFTRYLSQGMVPNFFPKAVTPLPTTRWMRHSGCADSLPLPSLHPRWETAQRYWLDALREILHWHLNGTRYGIHADEHDGLLTWEAESEALTWIDAKVKGKPVVSRNGKTVEVNALWVNALALIARISAQLDDAETARLAEAWSQRALKNFEGVFWNEERQCLFDCIMPDGTPDSSVRCNQLLALALPFRLLSPEREQAVLRCVEKNLLRPVACGHFRPTTPVMSVVTKERLNNRMQRIIREQSGLGGLALTPMPSHKWKAKKQCKRE